MTSFRPKTDILIAYASWEERFTLGLERDFADYSPERLLLFYSGQYESWTDQNRALAQRICGRQGVEFAQERVPSSEATWTWNAMKALPDRMRQLSVENIVLDISTMPRDALWMSLFFLRQVRSRINYVYHSPEDYDSEWLSRDPLPPRLVFKHSGVLEFGRPTAVFVVTGFDIERTFEFLTAFEPKEMILGFQTGTQYRNEAQNVEGHMERLRRYSNVPMRAVELDSYSPDHGESVIKQCLSEYRREMNIIASSLGPKPSALALYKAWEDFPEIALAYAPSGEYNKNYSSGLKETFRGVFADTRPE